MERFTAAVSRSGFLHSYSRDLNTFGFGGADINRLFDSETPIWALFGRLADIAVLSLLWSICSLPVITMGAASAALMRAVMNMHTNEGNWRARHYFRYFRRNLRNATLLWLAFLAFAAVLIADLIILSGASGTSASIQRSAAVLGLIIWVIMAIWAFTLTSLFESTFVQTIKNAFYLGISWLPRSILMSVLWVLPVALLVFMPDVFSRIVVLWPALFWGGTAFLCAGLMHKPLKPYLPEEPEDEFEEYETAE